MSRLAFLYGASFFTRVFVCKTCVVQVAEIQGELSSRKQEEAKRRRDVQEIREQITALELELNSLDETVDYQVT